MPQRSAMLSDVPDFYGLPDQLADLMATGNDASDGLGHIDAQAAMAWYLRQRDTVRAQAIAEHLCAALEGATDIETATRQRLRARMALTRAECCYLAARSGESVQLLSDATELFHAIGDEVGLGDCALLRAEIFVGAGDSAAAVDWLCRAVEHFDGACDLQRRSIAGAVLDHQRHYGGGSAGTTGDGDDDRSAPPTSTHPGVQACRNLYRGGLAFRRGDFLRSIEIWGAAFDQALEAGAMLLAIHLATVTGASYANLFDLPTALEWKEKAFAIAKAKGWPQALGATLSSMAETTTSLGQHERAHALFAEALPYLRAVPPTRRHVIAWMAYGNLYRAEGKLEQALRWYREAEPVARQVAHPDLLKVLEAALASVLLGLGQLQEAEVLATRIGGDGATSNPYYEMESLRVLAGVRWARTGDPQEAVALLLQAIAKGEALDGMTGLRSDLYEDLARAYEAAGDFGKALSNERKARENWQRNFDRQNADRIHALQVRFDTAQAKAEAENQRLLANAEAARAVELDRANQTLERLGFIGQEITARLNSEAVFVTLSRHLRELMRVDTLFVGLKDDGSQVIDIRFRVDDGNRLPPRQVSMASDSLSARCVRDNEEILVTLDDPAGAIGPGRRMRTMLYRPLALGERVLGVVSVQSELPDAYGSRELLIFRTICAYGAIAMANAEAYQQLDRAAGETRDALQRLMQQEKMAALGQLVAGVAHEVNTPLGVTLSAISQLNDNIRQLRDLVGKGSLTRLQLTEALDNGGELASLAQRNVVRAADMVRTFKGVAVDQGTDERRLFDLDEYLSEVVSLVRARMGGSGSRVEIDVASVPMDTYPGALAQVVTNLMTNVADHAYPTDAPGRILVRGHLSDPATVEISVVDDGVGIPADLLPKVFDPFFTTRRAAGSMGLGLHVAFNQVTQRLCGSIVLDSVPGRGTVATLRIPREVPVFPAVQPSWPVDRARKAPPG